LKPDDELERFLKDFSSQDRKYLEGWPEYHRALKKGTTTAIEVASIILLNNLGAGETMRLLKKHFPDL
jgi:hypothetical protein